jgi:hypothetical protein
MSTKGRSHSGTVGRMAFWNGLGLAIALVLPMPASAAPPGAATLAVGLVGQGQFGTIKGRLVWGGAEVPQPIVDVQQGKATRDPEICAKDGPILSRDITIDPKTKGVANGFAYVVRPKGANPEAVQSLISAHPKVELDQIACQFMPYTLAMHQDQVLVIKSSDPKSHNVRFNSFGNGSANEILAPKGQLEKRLVAERFPITLACDIHPWMKGYLMVFDHPFFTITGTDGSFELKGVPAGEQNLVVRQENVGWVTPGVGKGMPVTVKAGGVTDVGEIKVDPATLKVKVAP